MDGVTVDSERYWAEVEAVDGSAEPDVYRHAADELDIDPAECVAVEDSTHGVASATAAGMTRIGYRGVDAKDFDLAADSAVDGPQSSGRRCSHGECRNERRTANGGVRVRSQPGGGGRTEHEPRVPTRMNDRHRTAAA